MNARKRKSRVMTEKPTAISLLQMLKNMLMHMLISALWQPPLLVHQNWCNYVFTSPIVHNRRVRQQLSARE